MGAELFPVTGMIDHITVSRDGHSVIYLAHIARNYNIRPAGIHLKDGIARFAVLINDVFYSALKLEQFARSIFLHSSHPLSISQPTIRQCIILL